jgi:hypothetical protein
MAKDPQGKIDQGEPGTPTLVPVWDERRLTKNHCNEDLMNWQIKSSSAENDTTWVS